MSRVWTWLVGHGTVEHLARWVAWTSLFAMLGIGYMVAWHHFWTRELIGWRTGEPSPLLAAWHPTRDFAWAGAVVLAVVLVAILLRERIPTADRTLFVGFSALLLLGGLMLARLAPDLALHRQRAAFGALAGSQLKTGLLALAVMVGTVYLLNPTRLARLGQRKYVLLAAGIALIAATIVVGVTLNSRRLWLTVGSLTLQPVELFKLVVITFLAFYLAEEAPVLRMTVRHPFALPPLRVIGAGVLMVGLALSALTVQGDFGPVVQLYLVAIAMAYLATGSLTLIGVSLGCFLGGGALAYWLHFPSVVRTRIDMWANPFDLSEGMTRALWSIASGGLWGKGLGSGHPEMVPVVHSDYILAGIAEEMGMLGVAAVLLIYMTLAVRGYTIAATQPTLHGRLLAAGLTTALWVQVFIVAGGNSGWIPVTGLTLPGLSHGGTSLIATAVAIGVLLRLSASSEPLTASNYRWSPVSR